VIDREGGDAKAVSLDDDGGAVRRRQIDRLRRELCTVFAASCAPSAGIASP
jgi:hypothetical protein